MYLAMNLLDLCHLRQVEMCWYDYREGAGDCSVGRRQRDSLSGVQVRRSQRLLLVPHCKDP